MKILLLVSILISHGLCDSLFRTPLCMEFDEPISITAEGPHKIVMQGVINGDCWINLIDGNYSKVCSDHAGLPFNILLHLVPRVSTNHLVRTSYIHNVKDCIGPCKAGWGTSEESGGMPITAGKPFEIVIIGETNYLQIYVDGKHFAAFEHKVPLERATNLYISGDVKFSKIEIVKPGKELDAECCNIVNHIKIN